LRILLAVVSLALASLVQAKPTIGNAAPPIRVSEAFQAPDDASFDLESLRGDVVVLEFWATWCGPCVAAIPHLNELAEEFAGEDVLFISITKEDRATVERFMKKREMKSWVVRDEDGATNAAYGVRGIPNTFIINAEGVLVADTHPTRVTAEHIRTALEGGTPELETPSERIYAGERPGGDDDLKDAEFRFTIERVDEAVGRMMTGMNAATFEGVNAEQVMRAAYGVNSHRIEGTEHLPEGFYTVVAKAPVRGSEALYELIRPGIEATFNVRTRREARTAPSLRLELDPRREMGLEELEDPIGFRSSSSAYRVSIEGGNTGVLASQLSTSLGMTVEDHTGLTGRYNAEALIDESLRTASHEERLGAWREALLEQLGLRLVDDHAEMEFLIIEPRE